MVLATPLIVALSIVVIMICVGGAALVGGLVGPCAVGRNAYDLDCCCLWMIILLVVLAPVMLMCSLAAAVSTIFYLMALLGSVLFSYLSIIRYLICAQEE
jgi:hypothetical protein